VAECGLGDQHSAAAVLDGLLSREKRTLMSLKSNPPRYGVVGTGVALLTVATQPARLWRAQLPRLAALAAFLFLATAIGSDGVPPVTQPRIAAAAQVLSGPAAENNDCTPHNPDRHWSAM
jgi:hypothetical protein